MVSETTPIQANPVSGAEPTRGQRWPRLTGAVLILGAVTYGVNALLFDRIVYRYALGGPPGLMTVLENPLWAIYRLAGMVGILLIAVGFILLLDRLYTREQWKLVVAGLGSLGISTTLFLIELAIAVQATGNIIGGAGGIGLTEGDVGLVLTAYQGIGVALLKLAILFLGATFAIIGYTLSQWDEYTTRLARSGVIAGILVVLIGLSTFLGLVELLFPEPYSQVLAGVWVLALGLTEIRRA